MNTSELRKKSVEELNSHLIELLQEQFNLRIQNSMGQLNQTHQLKAVRRNIARVKTILTENSGTPVSAGE